MQANNPSRALHFARFLALVSLAGTQACAPQNAPQNVTQHYGRISCQCNAGTTPPEPRAAPNGECLPAATDAGCQTFYPAGGALPPPEMTPC